MTSAEQSPPHSTAAAPAPDEPGAGGTEATPSIAAPPGRGRRRVALAIFALAVGGFGIGTTEFSIMGLLPNVARGLDVSNPEAGHLISAYALGVVVGAPVLATLGSRWPRKYLALGLMLLFTLANLSSFFAPDYGWLMLSRFISGLPHGAYFGVAAVIAASIVAPTKRGRAIAAVMLGLSVANVVGVPAATWIGQQWGWRLMFVMVAAIGALTLLLVARNVPFQSVHADASIRKELGALKRIQVWMTLLIGIVGFGGFFAVYTYIAPTMTQVAGLDVSALPLVVGLYGVGMVVGNIVGGRIADISLMGSIYACMLVITAMLLAFFFLAPFGWVAALMVFLVGCSGSMLIPSLQTRLMDVSVGAPSLGASLNHAALNIANALGAFLGGLVVTAGWGYRAPALVGAVLAVFGLGIALTSGRLDVLTRRRRLASSG